MPFARLGGSSRPSLKLGAGAGVERWAELTQYRLLSENGTTTFMSTYEGDTDRPTYLAGEAYQSQDTGSLWRFTWDNTGKAVPFRLAPHGNPTATSERPHYVGTVTIGPRPELGGTATDDTFVFAFAWRVHGDVQRVTA